MASPREPHLGSTSVISLVFRPGQAGSKWGFLPKQEGPASQEGKGSAATGNRRDGPGERAGNLDRGV